MCDVALKGVAQIGRSSEGSCIAQMDAGKFIKELRSSEGPQV
jgi:hypothetical protein